MFDVIIVGAGPAGMSAALILGRSRRNVLICDSGQPRNASSHAIHGFLTRDGIDPADFRRIGQEQLRQYANIEYRSTSVVDVVREANQLTLTLADTTTHSTRVMLLATGVVDTLPTTEGFDTFHGSGVFSCPYCDGWEVRDQPLAVYGQGQAGQTLAVQLLQWSRDIVLCTDGPSQLTMKELAFLHHNEIVVQEEPIARLEGSNGYFDKIVFSNGSTLARRAIFFRTKVQPRDELLKKLDINMPEQYQQPIAPGVFLSGDAYQSRWVSGAVADGAEAAVMINTFLQKEDLTREFKLLRQQ